VNMPYLAPERSLVVAIRRESHDTVTLDLTLPDSYGAWRPGQFNMLYLFGHGEIPISISGGSDTRTIMHTVKAVGSVSKAITALKAGDELWLRGPFGAPWPDLSATSNLEDDAAVVFVGGGIGLAPMRPSILSALNNKKKGRVIVLVGHRTPADVIFADDLQEWAQHPRATVMVTVDRVEPPSIPWDGEVGVVTNLLDYVGLDAPTASGQTSHARQTIALTCGPEVMMRYVAADLMQLGVNAENIFVSAERNMKCAVGMCGRCQWGPHFVCRDGPVYRWEDVRRLWVVKEF